MKHPDEVLMELKAAAGGNQRTCNNLDGIHKICGEICASDKIYTVAAVGRRTVRKQKDNPRERIPTVATLRSVKGEHFRKLIHAWAVWDLNAAVQPTRKVEPKTDDQHLLASISNNVTREKVGMKLAELKRLRTENNDLKRVTKIPVDMRPAPRSDGIQVVNPTAILTDSERLALTSLCDPTFLRNRGWKEGPNGTVVWALPGHGSAPILPAGTLTALQKLTSSQQTVNPQPS